MEIIKKYDSITSIRIDLSMLTFRKLCDLKLACHTYRIVNNIFPHLYIHLPILNEYRDRDTKHNNLYIPNLKKKTWEKTQ